MLGFTYLITIQCDYGHTMYETGDQNFTDHTSIAKALAHLQQISITIKYCTKTSHQATYYGKG